MFWFAQSDMAQTIKVKEMIQRRLRCSEIAKSITSLARILPPDVSMIWSRNWNAFVENTSNLSVCERFCAIKTLIGVHFWSVLEFRVISDLEYAIDLLRTGSNQSKWAQNASNSAQNRVKCAIESENLLEHCFWHTFYGFLCQNSVIVFGNVSKEGLETSDYHTLCLAAFRLKLERSKKYRLLSTT